MTPPMLGKNHYKRELGDTGAVGKQLSLFPGRSLDKLALQALRATDLLPSPLQAPFLNCC